jgi:predicted alpha/beta hydrolase family esterase
MKNLYYFILTKSIGLYINLLSFVFPKKAAQLAYAFFSEPRAGRLTEDKLPTVLLETQKDSFQYENHTIQTYTWKGDQKVIVLVHGWESNASRWENLIPFLRKSGSTIVAIDAPAHGLSSGKEFTIPTYASYINVIAEKFKPQYLIGHSLGGKTCLYYQSIYKNPSIEKMVILGAPSDFKVILNNYITLLSLNSKIAKALEEHYLVHFKLKINQFSGKLFAATLSIPGLIIHDKEDTVVLFKEGEKIASTWKKSRLIETKGLGHSLHDDEVYHSVSKFLFEH